MRFIWWCLYLYASSLIFGGKVAKNSGVASKRTWALVCISKDAKKATFYEAWSTGPSLCWFGWLGLLLLGLLFLLIFALCCDMNCKSCSCCKSYGKESKNS